ncbi:sensor histidine kinase [Vibrio superstes]|uniref:histidine kinase n=1 Tax=Vibrio superstes NBRC 103154 TaxID=1219062 RepID=A0A511QQC7_9VIBR|nr:HAMP domain-containing sensor histidine kinase [Vibrio superstes]GEM79554.1 hypothetical protein VSU01S_17990 [Vibrio superstes NBRC 103154]
MKIKTSLRLYVVGAMFIAGTLAILAMSAVAVSYFFSGMDVAMGNFMRSQAFGIEVSDGRPVQRNELTVASHWEDLPPSIQAHLTAEDMEFGILEKHIEGIPLIEAPKGGYFALKLERNGETRFVSMELNDKEKIAHFEKRKVPRFFYILLFALVTIGLLAVALLVLVRKVSTPVRGLRNWAKALDKEDLTKPAPDFRYGELNALANIIQSSLASVQESLEREQRFLGYASHELRTPIAVMRSNTELLNKMIEKGVAQEKQQQVLERIERAGFTMTDLTETLLWLNRQQGKSLPKHAVLLSSLVEEISSDLEYLLRGKEVKVLIATDETKVTLPVALSRIVITNLIRNAFQHTFAGEVRIQQTQNNLVIVNRDDSKAEESSDLGFGLGLELTERLVQQYGWYYENIDTDEGHKVEIHFVE